MALTDRQFFEFMNRLLEEERELFAIQKASFAVSLKILETDNKEWIHARRLEEGF